MTNGSDDPGIIPLSRWRAALARARRNRAAVLLEAPDAAQLIPQMPVQELYFAIKEQGLADSRDILALASPEQIQGFFDLDAWDRGALDVEKLRPWLDMITDIGPEKLGQVIESMDAEVIALYVQRQCKVYDITLEEAPPDEDPEGSFFPTPDGFYLLDVLPGGEAGKSMEHLIDWLYRADLLLARRVVMSARWEMPSDLEEWSLRWRNGRMADLGYVDYYDALTIYRYLDPASVKLDEKSARDATVIGPHGASALPALLAGQIDERGFFARALTGLDADAEVERVHGALLTLVNKILSADRVEPGDSEKARAALTRAAGYLSIGLESISRSDLPRATDALSKIALERVFRVGFSLTLQLQRLATSLIQSGRVGKGEFNLLEPPYRELTRLLAGARPEYPATLDTPPGNIVRPFLSLLDVSRAAHALKTAAEQAAFVCDGLGIRIEAIAEVGGTLTSQPSEIRFGTLIRTLTARLFLSGTIALDPIAGADIRPLKKAIAAETDLLSKIEAVLLARLTERAQKRPEAIRAWLEVWLKDLTTAIDLPGGLLVHL